jgi:hypothetical protein
MHSLSCAQSNYTFFSQVTNFPLSAFISPSEILETESAVIIASTRARPANRKSVTWTQKGRGDYCFHTRTT